MCRKRPSFAPPSSNKPKKRKRSLSTPVNNFKVKKWASLRVASIKTIVYSESINICPCSKKSKKKRASSTPSSRGVFNHLPNKTSFIHIESKPDLILLLPLLLSSSSKSNKPSPLYTPVVDVESPQFRPRKTKFLVNSKNCSNRTTAEALMRKYWSEEIVQKIVDLSIDRIQKK